MGHNMAVETDITKRWEQGMLHHPKSIALFKKLEAIDFKFGGDHFCWKSGGDGDNGEHLMYEMDIMFDLEDHALESQPVQLNARTID